MNNSKNRSRFLGLIILFLVGIFWLRNITVKEQIMTEGKLTYGKLTAVNETGWYSSRGTNFFYFVNGNRLFEASGNYPNDSLKNRVKIGNYYEVKYLAENPEKCLMLFNRPVRDTTIFLNAKTQQEKIKTRPSTLH